MRNANSTVREIEGCVGECVWFGYVNFFVLFFFIVLCRELNSRTRTPELLFGRECYARVTPVAKRPERLLTSHLTDRVAGSIP